MVPLSLQTKYGCLKVSDVAFSQAEHRSLTKIAQRVRPGQDQGSDDPAVQDYRWSIPKGGFRQRPHIAGRPLSLLRRPSGTGAKLLFRQASWHGLDDGVRRVDTGDKPPMVSGDLTGLISLVHPAQYPVSDVGVELFPGESGGCRAAVFIANNFGAPILPHERSYLNLDGLNGARRSIENYFITTIGLAFAVTDSRHK